MPEKIDLEFKPSKTEFTLHEYRLICEALEQYYAVRKETFDKVGKVGQQPAMNAWLTEMDELRKKWKHL